MQELEVKRELSVVTAEIITIRDNTQKMVLEASIQIGRRLCEAKELVGHGAWGGYLRDKVEFSQSTANNLMRIYQEFGDEQLMLGKPPKSQTFGNLTYSQAVAILAVPEDEREAIVTENDMEEISVAELKRIIEEKEQAAKQALHSLSEAENKAELAEKRAKEAAAAKEKADKEISNLKIKVDKARLAAGEAQQRVAELEEQDIPPEEIERIKAEAQAEAQELIEKANAIAQQAQARIAELEETAGQIPEEEISKIKAEAEAEAQEQIAKASAEADQAKAQAEELQRKLEAAKDQDMVEANMYFRQAIDSLGKLCDTLGRIRAKDPQKAEKLQAAIDGSIDQIRQRMGG